MGIMFVTIPIPKNKGLITYRFSLRVLSAAYFLLSALAILVILFNITDSGREHFAFTSISISSFQALLYTGALITLFNPGFVTSRFLVKHILPFIIFTILFVISSVLYGNPVIAHLNEVTTFVKKPSVIIRLLFFCYYIFQLVLYTYLFFRQEKRFRNRAMNYFSDERWVKLSWVRVAFLAALTIGIIVMLTNFFPRKYDGFFTLLYSAFYLLFAINYIRYNKIFRLIEPVVIQEQAAEIIEVKTRQKIEWPYLKNTILSEKYYLESGINIEEIARRLKVGRTTLSNLINKEEGINYNGWINNLRIEYAKQILIKNPAEPLSSVSEKVGFTEQANFSRQFRKATGFAPTLWRQRELGGVLNDN